MIIKTRVVFFFALLSLVWPVAFFVNADVAPIDTQACIEVPNTALNTVTGEIKLFLTSCIPEGWEFAPVDASLEELGEQLGEKQAAREEHIRKIQATAALLVQGTVDTLLAQIGESRSQVEERFTAMTYLKNIADDLKELSQNIQEALIAFVAYGVDDNSKALGQGERAAVVYSYKDAYEKLPQTDREFSDMIKIINGRFPSERNSAQEEQARAEFKRIYKRVGNTKDINDNAALMIMTYGLQQMAADRNLASERMALKTFASVYDSLPRVIHEWNIMRAITYSGARRKIDTDRDMLADEDEKQFGTNARKRDTDGDGYSDGLEVEKGYNPLVQQK